jgi:hypothetical protein
MISKNDSPLGASGNRQDLAEVYRSDEQNQPSGDCGNPPNLVGTPRAVRPEFKRFHLNIWGQAENRAIDMRQWAACGGELRALVERPCYAGVDLSSTTDLTSLGAGVSGRRRELRFPAIVLDAGG